MNVYVGNLSYDVTEESLKELFEAHGGVASVNIIKDKYTGQSKGFAFVEMDRQFEAEEAIKKLNGSLFSGRNLKVNLARTKTERSKSRSRSW